MLCDGHLYSIISYRILIEERIKNVTSAEQITFPTIGIVGIVKKPDSLKHPQRIIRLQRNKKQCIPKDPV